MNNSLSKLFLAALSLCLSTTATAQRFYNLTASQVEIDSVLPYFSYNRQLTGYYADSVYTVTIKYPEFIDMSAADIERYKRLTAEVPPVLPKVTQSVGYNRRKPMLTAGFTPIVYRNGKYQFLVSFMLDVSATPKPNSHIRKSKSLLAATADRYKSHSVLASGNWAKIRVPSTGFYRLTPEIVKKAGFTDINKVKIYGYGGNLQSEVLSGAEIKKTDDLTEVPTATINGSRVFYAKGPVYYSNNLRVRNPYSSYGYYFITQNEDTALVCDSATLVSANYPAEIDRHALYEVDAFSWYHGGRNLFDKEEIQSGFSRKYVFKKKGEGAASLLQVAVTAATASNVKVSFNNSVVGTQTVSIPTEYDKAAINKREYSVNGNEQYDTITLEVLSGGPVRLDYIDVKYAASPVSPDINTANLPTPEYVYNITNQDHHADPQADMVIIIPTSQKWCDQAERLKAFHEAHDNMRLNIVPADELYNEFSSGTPDAAAYRKYLKMLYDRATTDADMPKYLLLFGDGSFDNRMLTPEMNGKDPDDYLLCYESEDSYNEITCYVDDGWFCLLDDGEGTDPQRHDMPDVAVGRLPVTTAAEAKVVVDKTISYMENRNAGAWQNTIMFMGDDGDKNIHMQAADAAATLADTLCPGYIIKKVMWDAYERQTSSNGNTYPDVTKLIKQQQTNGALIMNYSGHGVENQISHEKVLTLSDFVGFTNKNLPLWITASCDIMPFDGVSETIGETAILSEKGGAVAFFGTTRTVYASYNKRINEAYIRYVLGTDSNGNPISIGEAQRLAKCELITTGQDRTTNKLQYSLLGDPAVILQQPRLNIIVDSINGKPANDVVQLKAGSIAKISGHIEKNADFNGVITATVRDANELVTCRMNDVKETTTAFQYYDRTKIIFQGTDSVKQGSFEFSLAIPLDISYTSGTGLINLFAVSSDKSLTAHGKCEAFTLNGSSANANDSIGPSIYCYLNSPSFVNGGNVNPTPFFVAEITDDNGINSSGNGIGHNLQLIIDGKKSMTYDLNDNFSFDFGSYTSGSTYYSIPELEAGAHKLLFRAWDTYNNASTTELSFNVVKALKPNFFSVSVTDNPASESTTFIINHDRTGSELDVELQIFDMAGRQLWNHTESGVSSDNTYTLTWDLTTDGGARLQTGVYLYRVRISSDGSSKTSKAQKLIVIN